MVCERLAHHSVDKQPSGLNPCFNGIWSASIPLEELLDTISCLNPCFNGIWSARLSRDSLLPLPPLRLNPCFNGIWSASREEVVTLYHWKVVGLNPCFNGIWSAR